jgi:hypothetical protein
MAERVFHHIQSIVEQIADQPEEEGADVLDKKQKYIEE